MFLEKIEKWQKNPYNRNHKLLINLMQYKASEKEIVRHFSEWIYCQCLLLIFISKSLMLFIEG